MRELLGMAAAVCFGVGAVHTDDLKAPPKKVVVKQEEPGSMQAPATVLGVPLTREVRGFAIGEPKAGFPLSGVMTLGGQPGEVVRWRASTADAKGEDCCAEAGECCAASATDCCAEDAQAPECGGCDEVEVVTADGHGVFRMASLFEGSHSITGAGSAVGEAEDDTDAEDAEDAVDEEDEEDEEDADEVTGSWLSVGGDGKHVVRFGGKAGKTDGHAYFFGRGDEGEEHAASVKGLSGKFFKVTDDDAGVFVFGDGEAPEGDDEGDDEHARIVLKGADGAEHTVVVEVNGSGHAKVLKGLKELQGLKKLKGLKELHGLKTLKGLKELKGLKGLKEGTYALRIETDEAEDEDNVIVRKGVRINAEDIKRQVERGLARRGVAPRISRWRQAVGGDEEVDVMIREGYDIGGQAGPEHGDAGGHAELLDLMRELRDEVKQLRKEVKDLRRQIDANVVGAVY